MAAMRDRVARRPWTLALRLCLGLCSACSESTTQLPLAPIPLGVRNGLLYAVGDIQPTLDERCATTPEDGAPPGSGVAELMVDTGTPLTTVVPSNADSPRQFPHGQVTFRTARPDGTVGGIQFVRCNIPVVRSAQTTSSFLFRWGAQPSVPLGGVVGGDQLTQFSMALRFSGTTPTMRLARGDIATWCRIDRTVIPFKPIGGELAVQLGDTVITYPATRLTIGACVEPIADPLSQSPATVCVGDNEISTTLSRLDTTIMQYRLQTPRDDTQLGRLLSYQTQLLALKDGLCPEDQRTLLGDLADELGLRNPAYSASGTNMRFLVSTAVPELLLTQTACQRLTGKSCTCDRAVQIPWVLPGLNSTKNDDGTFSEAPDYGCRIQLGDAAHAALAIVAKQRQLAPCDELARSRRQRYALRAPAVDDPPGEDCRRQACLRNLGRDPALLGRRCGYSGLDSDLACNDKLSPVAAWLELGGRTGKGTTDQLDAIVVPDSAAIIQSINADVHNLAAQVDGVIGVATLRRLYSIIDYPQGRLELACRCDLLDAACHAYRGITYRTADDCVDSDVLAVPSDFGRPACEP